VAVGRRAAAVGRAVAAVTWGGGEVPAPADTGEGGGDLTRSIRQALVDIQFGRAEDSFGWMHRIV